ncbi:hypothetical protein M405DRAFT_813423, partial [Rhizopogon salebrosus TDB-379]
MMCPQRFHHPPAALVHSCMPCNLPAPLMHHLHLPPHPLGVSRSLTRYHCRL